MLSPRVRAALAALAIALACGGCGLAGGSRTQAVTLTVTRGFGSHQLALIDKAHVPGAETVMRMLERSLRITTRSGGGSVESIDGLRANNSSTDWFYYVNGVQGPPGAATTSVHAGDHIWWDLHDFSATQSIPAVVGSFPEPFVNGIAGKRYPVTIECATDVSAACKQVTAAMVAAHVPAAPQLLGTGSGPDTLGIVVGTWNDIKSQVDAELVAYGPGASGVYAHFADNGSQLAVENPSGHVVKVLGAGAGLIAATGDPSNVPTWMITGTDAAGVADAARSLTARALHDHFALAVSGSQAIPVPLQDSS